MFLSNRERETRDRKSKKKELGVFNFNFAPIQKDVVLINESNDVVLLLCLNKLNATYYPIMQEFNVRLTVSWSG